MQLKPVSVILIDSAYRTVHKVHNLHSTDTYSKHSDSTSSVTTLESNGPAKSCILLYVKNRT